MSRDIKTQVAVIGGGPGGYACAFRAADLGMEVTLIERHSVLGGVCLNVGCIPSKALLHIAEMVNESKEFADRGVVFQPPKIDHKKLREWLSTQVISQLNSGIDMLARKRKVKVVHGDVQFKGPKSLTITDGESSYTCDFEQAVIATGSSPIKLDFLPDDPRIMDSTGALELKKIDGSMMILGGGIIGTEMACVYQALGVDVTICEMMDQIMPGVDAELVKVCAKTLSSRGIEICTQTKCKKVKATQKGLEVTFEDKAGKESKKTFDQMIVAVGRRANGDKLSAESAHINVDERGVIGVDARLMTSSEEIYAIGDVAGMNLAHEATTMGHACAEIMAGHLKSYQKRIIPSVSYTDPEVAWAGLTEADAKAQGVPYRVARFPWMASGRSLSHGRKDGMTKLIIHKEHNTVLGAAIVGSHAGELIAECVLAIEMCCDVEDLALSVHPHPTFSETIALAAECDMGTVTDL